MLDAQLILMFKLLNLFLWSLLVMLLVLGSRLNATLHLLADEQDLAVLVVQVLRLDFDPSQSAELVDKSGNGQSWTGSHIGITYSLGKSGFWGSWAEAGPLRSGFLTLMTKLPWSFIPRSS